MSCDYKLFTGDLFADVMRSLLEEGYVPAGASWLMERRINARGKPDELQWWDCIFDTGDGIVMSPRGALKVRPSSPTLCSTLLAKSLAHQQFYLLHNHEQYGMIPEVEIASSVWHNDFGRALRPGEAEHHPGWQALARADVRLVREYERALRTLYEEKTNDSRFSNLRFLAQRCNGELLAMGFFTPPPAPAKWNTEVFAMLSSFTDGYVGGISHYPPGGQCHDVRLIGLVPSEGLASSLSQSESR